MRYYILGDNNTPVQVDDSLTGWKWLEENPYRKIVGSTRFPSGTRVSTVFLTLDHGYDERGAPVLWETMIFGGLEDQFQDRYTSFDDAVLGHLACVKRVMEQEIP